MLWKKEGPGHVNEGSHSEPWKRGLPSVNGEAADEGWGDRRSVLDVSVKICQPHGPGGRGRETAGQVPLEEPRGRHTGCPQSQEEGCPQSHSCHPAWGPA